MGVFQSFCVCVCVIERGNIWKEKYLKPAKEGQIVEKKEMLSEYQVSSSLLLTNEHCTKY